MLDDVILRFTGESAARVKAEAAFRVHLSPHQIVYYLELGKCFVLLILVQVVRGGAGVGTRVVDAAVLVAVSLELTLTLWRWPPLAPGRGAT